MEMMVAPCGINCSVCIAHMRDKKKCPGCLSPLEKNKAVHCSRCKIKLCDEHDQAQFTYCFECKSFPCTRLRNLNKRYTTKYHTDLISNLESIRDNGINQFIENENIKWVCPHCGEKLSIHKDYCLKCKEYYR